MTLSTAEAREMVVAAIQDGCPLARITRPSFTERRYVVHAELPCSCRMVVEGWHDDDSIQVDVLRKDGSYRFGGIFQPLEFPDEIAFALSLL